MTRNLTASHLHTKLVVVGQGYVGLPIAMRAVQAGFRVVGIDLDTVRPAALAAGESYIEGVSTADVAFVVCSGRCRPTAGYAEAEDFDGSHRRCASSSC